MSKILLQTTIVEHPDDWDISRFSLLADELRSAGHEVTARNRVRRADDDPMLSRLDELDYDQLWLMAVDIGDGLTAADAEAIMRFRENGGGVLTARDHQDLGSCLLGLGSLGEVNQFHEKNPDPSTMCDDQDTPTISWPNYHSGANGDYQPVFADEPAHELLRTTADASGRIEWFPAHPHEGAVSACVPVRHGARAGPQHRTGRRFNLAVVLDGERGTGRQADGPRARRVDVPPLRRLQLGSRSRRAVVRHRTAGHADQGRPDPAGRSSRTTSATSRPGCIHPVPGTRRRRRGRQRCNKSEVTRLPKRS